jgi:SMC interacting uncharacterized protein involved in chromosome segregation
MSPPLNGVPTQENTLNRLAAAKLSETKLTQETQTLTQEVNMSTLREVVLKEREAALQQKSNELAVQISKLNSEVSAREEEYSVLLGASFIETDHCFRLRRVNTKCSVRIFTVLPLRRLMKSSGSPRAF